MTTVKVTANGQGEYWFDVEVAGERKTALMDTGFTGAAAIAVNRENWDRIKNALTERGSGGTATDYQGNATTVEYGKSTAKIVGFETEVEKRIIYAGSAEDLLGSNFFHNFPDLEMNWSFRDKTITLTEIEVDSDENGELESCTKETEEGEKKMDKNESFKQAFEQNKTFYQKAKNRLRKDYCGQYVIIGAGQLLDVQATYDLAIEKANKLKQKLLHVMIFRADEEPLLGTIKFGIRSTRGYPEN